jgi:hypothetical protein
MECILDTKNRVTTECGHCFHTNCLMTSVAHNGFGCPYCRTAMAEAVDDDDDDDDEWGSVDSDEEEDNDRALRGFRFMFNRLAGEPNDQDDNLEEDEDEEEEAAADEDEDKPSPDYITQKLVEQGVSMSQLVKVMLSAHEEYANEESFDRIDDELYGKLRIIISNYRPEPATIQEVVTVPAAVVAVDFDAQPKSSNVVSRRMMGRL